MRGNPSFKAICLRGFVAVAASLVTNGGSAWSQSGDARVLRIAEPFLPNAGIDQKGPYVWPESLKEEIVQRLNADIAPLMLTTTTRHGVYSITLRIDADRQASETRRVIQSILAAHSGGAGLQVTEPDAGRIPILSIVLSSGALTRLEVSDYAARHIQPRLVRSLDGAGDVHLCRDMSTALMVHLDPSVWRRLDVTGGDMHDVLGPAIAGFGGETGYAGVTRKGDSYAIALAPGSVRALDGQSLADRQIALPDGRRIQLRDIARVEVGAQPTHDFCFYRGRRATIVQVDPRRPVGLDETLTRLGQEVQAISRDLPTSIDLTIVPTSTTNRR